MAMVVIGFLPCPVQAASAQWEYYNTNDDSAVHIYGVNWSAQTFTTGAESHTVSQIRLLLYRESTPGTITVSLQATDGGAPDGFDLTSGTTNADNSITTSTSGVWYGIDVTPVSLEAATQYAVVVRNPSGTGTTVDANWRMDGSAGTYADGSEWASTNSGISWVEDTDDDFMFEIWGESLIAVYSSEVYRDYMESDDLLFAIHYFNTYVPYYPDYDPTRYFYIQLRSTDGSTVIANTLCNDWGNKPASIYLSADQAAALTWGTGYRIYIYGDFTGTPSAYYTLQSTDWRGTDLYGLDAWVLLKAHNMESYYSVVLTAFIASKGEVLNEEGGIIFDRSIPGLSTVRPDLFQALVHSITHDDTDFDYTFSETTPEDILGPAIMNVADSFAGIFGMEGKDMLGFLMGAIYVACGIFLVAKGHVTAGIVVGFPIIALGAYFRVIDIVIVGVVLSVIVGLGVWSLWWSRT